MAPGRWLIAVLATLVLSGAGGLAVAAPPPLSAYTQQPAIQLVRLSPSGRRLAFVAVEGDRKRLFVRQVGGEALAMINLGEAKTWNITWAGDDRLVAAVSRAVGGPGKVREQSSALVLDPATGKSFWVFDGRPDVQHEIAGYSGVRQVGGRWFGYFRGASESDHPMIGLYQVDLVSGATRRVAVSNNRTVDWILGQDGEVAARVDYDAPTQELRLLAGAEGERVLFRKAKSMGQVQFDGLGRTPDTVLMLDSTGDEDVYAEIRLDDGSTTQLAAGDYESVMYDPGAHLLVGARRVSGKGQVFFDPRMQARYDEVRKAFPEKLTHVISRDAAFDRLVVYTNGPHDAGTYWLVEGADVRRTKLAEANPTVPPEELGESRLVSYRAQDGLQIEGVLTLPPEREPHGLPLIMMPHGGPIGVEDTLGYDWWAQVLASRGYAVFQPNFRGSGGYGAAFRKAGFGQWGRKMQTDLSDGVAALAGQGIVDPKRVCIFGGSYGGYAALAGVTLQKGIYRCAVSISGVSDLGQRLAELGDPKSFASPQARFEQLAMGASWAGDPVLKEISPVYHADQASAPILLIHGKDDSVVPISQSEHMAAALQKAGKTYQLIRLDGGDHWLSLQKTRDDSLAASMAFFEKWNPPG